MPKLPKHVRLHRESGRYRAVLTINGKRKVGPLRDAPDEAASDVPILRGDTGDRQDRRPTLQHGYDLLVADNERRGLRADTVAYYEQQWGRITQTPPKGWSTDWPLADLTVDQVYRYARRRLETGEVGPATVWKKEVQTLMRIVHLAVRRRLIKRNPIEGLEIPQVRAKRFESFSAGRVREVLKQVRESTRGREATRIRDALIIEAIYLSGMRRSEFARLQVRDFDRDNRRLFIDGKKRDRFLPLGQRLSEVLAELSAGKAPDALLGAKRSVIEKLFIRWSSRLGTIQISPHRMRHSMATAAVEAGIDPFRLATLLGHADIKQTQRYYHASDEAQRDALDAIAKHQGHAGTSAEASSS